MAMRLIAFDFGSTTSKALEASAEIARNAVTGRSEIRALTTIARSEPVFTPFMGDDIDEGQINALVDAWLAGSATASDTSAAASTLTIAGGVIITGLAAKKANAKKIAEAVRRRIGEAVVAVADDPRQESWLAFMGSCLSLSRAYPSERFLNFDIGGGTTNIALGTEHGVTLTGSLWVGARHLRFKCGTYELEGLSPYGERLLRHLKIAKNVGDRLEPAEIAAITGFYVNALEGTLDSSHDKTRFVEQARLPRIPRGPRPALTFSGGVGELVYRIAGGEVFPVTPYGDLGADLAQAIVDSPTLALDLKRFQPANLGRATVCGLAFHGVEASGATVFMRDRSLLPLRDLPMLGRFGATTSQTEMDELVAHAKNSPHGGCLQAVFEFTELSALRTLAGKVTAALKKNRFPKGTPLIIFIPQNIGKTFGNYATEWGQIAVDLIVIDEITPDAIDRKAYFSSVHAATDEKLGKPGESNLLVSFYGGLEETPLETPPRTPGRRRD